LVAEVWAKAETIAACARVKATTVNVLFIFGFLG
jgi:hypothetical protein